jgi:DNA processing protein
VPGSPLDPRAEGTNDLIRDGATLCAGIEHVTGVLEPLIASGPRLDRGAEEPHYAPGSEELWDELDLPDIARAPVTTIMPDAGADEDRDDAEASLITLLGPSPIAIDDLVRQSGLSIGSVQMGLLELEIAGRLERHGGNAVSLIAGR